MNAAVLLLSVLAASPVERFTLGHPDAAAQPSADGTRLVQASGLQARPVAGGPVEAARAYLTEEGAAFGIAPDQYLVLKGAPGSGRAGAVRFERRIGGLPVFGGDVVVGVDADNRVQLVNAGDLAPERSGLHAIGEGTAVAAALASFPGGARGAGPAQVAAGWRGIPGGIRPVYRVDLIAAEPAGDWRLYVDAESGVTLFREDRRFYASAPGSVYQVSPVEDLNGRCAQSGNGLSTCKTPVSVTLPNLVSAPPTTLAGTQTAVYNCRGINAPATAPGGCLAVSSVSGGFSFSPDTSWTSTTDDFSAAMAYYHLDKHVSFFKTLDPSLPGGTLRAINGSLPGLVNAFQNGAAFENAFYSGGLDAMVFGQGAHADYAYDATVAYHEMTHGVVEAWGGFNIDWDALGGLDEPAAVNEGTADAMAVSEVGRSTVGAFITSVSSPASLFLRDMSDPNATRSCHGNGSTLTQFGLAGVINGLDGEVHDDGEIWNGFYWEVYQGLKNANVKACGGACDAGPAIQYAALQLAGGTGPTLSTYWQTFKSAASNLFPGNANVASYVDCVARRRGMDKCDRTVPLYSGEVKLQFVRLRYGSFQVAIPVTGNATLSFCSAQGTPTIIHARAGSPVGLSGIDPNTGNATFAQDGQTSAIAQTCSGGATTVSLTSASATTWYLLVDSTGAFFANSPGFDIYKFQVSGAVATRPTPTAPATCTFGGAGGLAISPATASVATGGAVSFSASGGTAPYAWSFQTNASGGTINATTGAYVAGPTANVTDVVKVTDATLAAAVANVTVTASSGGGGGGSSSGGSSSKSGCGCGGGAGGAFTLGLAVLALLGWRPARRRS